MFEALSQEERDRIVDPKRAMKPPTKDQNQASVSPSKTIEVELVEPPPVKRQQKKSEIAESVVCCFNMITVPSRSLSICSDFGSIHIESDSRPCKEGNRS